MIFQETLIWEMSCKCWCSEEMECWVHSVKGKDDGNPGWDEKLFTESPILEAAPKATATECPKAMWSWWCYWNYNLGSGSRTSVAVRRECSSGLWPTQSTRYWSLPPSCSSGAISQHNLKSHWIRGQMAKCQRGQQMTSWENWFHSERW